MGAAVIRRWLLVGGIVVAVVFVAALGATALAQGSTNSRYNDGTGWHNVSNGALGVWDGMTETMGHMWNSMAGGPWENAHMRGMMGNWRGGRGGMMGNWRPIGPGQSTGDWRRDAGGAAADRTDWNDGWAAAE